MATKRKNPAETIAGIQKVLEEVKNLTNGPDHVKVGISPIIARHGVSSFTKTALDNLKIIEGQQSGGIKKYRWNKGVTKIDRNLAIKVYEEVKRQQVKAKAPSRNKKKLAQQTVEPIPMGVLNTPKPKEEVKREYVKPTKDKQTTVKTTIIKKEEPKPVQKQKIEFKSEWGTINGYKQLAFWKRIEFDRPTSVVVGDIEVIGVRKIRFEVKDSTLKLHFYNLLSKDVNVDQSSHMLTITKINTVIGLKEHHGDEQTGAFRITFVPVNDPYKVI